MIPMQNAILALMLTSYSLDLVSITIEVSVAELIDKITILQIKNKKIKDEKKLLNIRKELALLMHTYTQHMQDYIFLPELMQQLEATNQKLWSIEDAIRAKEAQQQFDQEFIALARSVYHTNDERSRIKRIINERCGSSLIEEKEYTSYP